jgi:hypothetical protein
MDRQSQHEVKCMDPLLSGGKPLRYPALVDAVHRVRTTYFYKRE